MFQAAVWFGVVALLALWSLTAWALHALGVWAVTNAGTLGAVRLPEWLAPWVPAELQQAATALMSSLEPLVQALLQTMPALAGGLTLAAWVVWALGSALLVGLGIVSHVLIAMWRRRAAGAPSNAFAGVR